MKAYERLLEYVKIDTESDPESGNHPSSEKQFRLARMLVQELKDMGVSNAYAEEHCIVYGQIEATKGYEQLPAIGFLAHMDTAPDFSGKDVCPVIHRNYDGKKIALGSSGRMLDPAVFPHLSALAGRTLITSDGTTLLGADDKAGIAEIMTMVERLLSEQIPHGKICICFTPDEEVGMGTDCVDLNRLGADFAYTVDGGEEGEVVYETFNAASAKIEFEGVNVHPGSAYGVMVNAALLAAEFAMMMPEKEVPAATKEYQGFFHLTDMRAEVEKATLNYIIRDHDRTLFEEKKERIRALVEEFNRRKGRTVATLTVKDSYYNMAEKIRPCFEVVEKAMEATRKAGIQPVVQPIRGGTDGARLSYMGLPTPNLGTGGYAFHGPFEHITAEGMELATQILVNIACAEE